MEFEAAAILFGQMHVLFNPMIGKILALQITYLSYASFRFWKPKVCPKIHYFSTVLPLTQVRGSCYEQE